MSFKISMTTIKTIANVINKNVRSNNLKMFKWFGYRYMIVTISHPLELGLAQNLPLPHSHFLENKEIQLNNYKCWFQLF